MRCLTNGLPADYVAQARNYSATAYGYSDFDFYLDRWVMTTCLGAAATNAYHYSCTAVCSLLKLVVAESPSRFYIITCQDTSRLEP